MDDKSLAEENKELLAENKWLRKANATANERIGELQAALDIAGSKINP